MNKTENLVKAIRLCAVSLVLLLSYGSSVIAQVDVSTQALPVQVSLKLDKKTTLFRYATSC